MPPRGHDAADHKGDVVKAEPAIIASGGANLASLRFALRRLGCDAPVTEDPSLIESASHVILPGVGAARDAMGRLRAAGLVDVIRGLRQPVLGICLGLQLLYSGSDEDDAECLGIIPGQARRFPQSARLRVPQMGWNAVWRVAETPLLQGVDDGGHAYFIHSYALPRDSRTCGVADYGGVFSAIVQQDNYFATQFHPERSARFGAAILSNFLRV